MNELLNMGKGSYSYLAYLQEAKQVENHFL